MHQKSIKINKHYVYLSHRTSNFHKKYTNPVRSTLDFCKQKFWWSLLCSQCTNSPCNQVLTSGTDQEREKEHAQTLNVPLWEECNKALAQQPISCEISEAPSSPSHLDLANLSTRCNFCVLFGQVPSVGFDVSFCHAQRI